MLWIPNYYRNLCAHTVPPYVPDFIGSQSAPSDAVLWRYSSLEAFPVEERQNYFPLVMRTGHTGAGACRACQPPVQPAAYRQGKARKESHWASGQSYGDDPDRDVTKSLVCDWSGRSLPAERVSVWFALRPARRRGETRAQGSTELGQSSSRIRWRGVLCCSDCALHCWTLLYGCRCATGCSSCMDDWHVGIFEGLLI